MKIILTFADYEQAALRTAPLHIGFYELQAREHDRTHAAMGLVTESAEVIDALKKNHAYGKELDYVNLREEVGDVLWYLPLLCRAYGWRLSDLARGVELFGSFTPEAYSERGPTLHDLARGLMYESATLLSLHTPPSRYTRVRAEAILMYLNAAADQLGTTLAEIATTNIAKLKARYPDKFTTEAALNRDLTAERAVLEGGAA